MKYALSPKHLYPFVYSGSAPSSWRDIDTSSCAVGKLYVYNETTNSTALIGDDDVVTFISTNQNIFYVTSDRTIIATDYCGSFFISIYKSDMGDISMIDAFGNYLYFVEGNSRVVVLDTISQSIYATVCSDSIMSAYMFSFDKLIWYRENGEAYYYDIMSNQSTPLLSSDNEAALLEEYPALETTDSLVTPLSSDVINNVGQPDNYNDIAFPLANYPAKKERRGYTPSVIYSRFLNNWEYDDPVPEVLNKKTYAGGARECDGFAKYAHDVFWHIDDWDRPAPSWGTPGNYTADYHSSYSWNNKQEMIDFFEGLNRGAFVRYTSKSDDTPSDGTHSYVFDGIDADELGMWHYECNQDWKCGVGYQYYTYSLYYQNNKCVFHYVNHAPSQNTPVAYNVSRHAIPCENCDGYLLQPHTGTSSFAQYNFARHKVQVSCCNGYALEYHVIAGNACFACGYVDNTGLLLTSELQ